MSWKNRFDLEDDARMEWLNNAIKREEELSRERRKLCRLCSARLETNNPPKLCAACLPIAVADAKSVARSNAEPTVKGLERAVLRILTQRSKAREE